MHIKLDKITPMLKR